ncbi:related to U2 snRNP component HSH155 [Saccharomycodes ludwigii]|uniref:Related to U2 snRNP component HSH155 n=1 Tax=Saccharomycodes ludwigii TaxID=36035 RepID=A0A376B4M6_9ASCO|nr:hypothetical protein SCDLUD_004743 [Saccharomycodes ludwigii]KAH3899306.1 hypothetical protein SCDLUD_004743 [Saccharomycodes ludwigii]SSD59657.1 related to U2 snRNP component HSH155 [Saccharomycodes ludwigii]
MSLIQKNESKNESKSAKNLLSQSFNIATEAKNQILLAENAKRKDEPQNLEQSTFKRNLDVAASRLGIKRKNNEGSDPATTDTNKKPKIENDKNGYHILSKSNSKITKKTINENVILEVPGIKDLQYFKASDKQFFGELLFKRTDKVEKSESDKKLYKVLKCLLRIKNGLPSSRKVAMKSLVDHAEILGPKLIFERLLPIILEKTLENQERFVLLKTLDKLLYKLQKNSKPFIGTILMVISPLLFSDDPVSKKVGEDVTTTLAHSVGAANMITTIRYSVDDQDDYIRNVTARILALTAKSLGPGNLLPFINAVCHSRKKWEARHTGIRSVQQLANLMGSSLLPYLNILIDCIKDGLDDEAIQVRMITVSCITALATASRPYGFGSFEPVLEELWKGAKSHRGKMLTFFLRAMAALVPLMDKEYASYYSREIMRIVQREIASPDDEMKKTVLLTIQRCVETEGAVTITFLKEELVPSFFKYYWNRRIALDIGISKMVGFTTVLLAKKMGPALVLQNIISRLKDSSEPLRVMTVQSIDNIFKEVENFERISTSLETQIVDGLLIAFQEQSSDTMVFVRAFSTVASYLGERMEQYLPPIISTILHRMKNKSSVVRKLSADLCCELVPVCKKCGQEELLLKLNVIYYESLGESYPEVLGSVLKVLNGIVSSTQDLTHLQPPISQLLPTLTPILKNSNVIVSDTLLKLISNIAQRAADYIPPKEWMRICFEILEILKSPNRNVRIQANETFGFIAESIGPQDILVSLLNNLKVQERQLRVSTSVAIGIIAKKCGPYTVIPALMNEYKTPDTNVQNGILKALAFLFEYIGELGCPYIYLISPILQDALTDRDLVHRQTAATILKNISLTCHSNGKEDCFIHLLNLLLPNIFETSPHAIIRIKEALDAVRIAVGPGVFMNYIWAGMFHSSRKVRKAFWSIYNNAYVQQCDSMVPYYLDIKGYEVEELNYVL